MGQQTILLVEDDLGALRTNKEFLEELGYCALTAESLAEAEKVLRSREPDLILLDVNLPDGSGLDFILRVRGSGHCFAPVIFLTARVDRADVVEGLKRGGCDYITKPYDFDVLEARIEAQLRAVKMQEVIKRGPLTLRLLSQQAVLAGKDMLLAKREFAILLLLLRNEGRTLTKEYIYEKTWGQPGSGQTVREVIEWKHGRKKKMPKLRRGRTPTQHRKNEGRQQKISVQILQPGVHSEPEKVGVHRRRTKASFAIITAG